MVARSTFAAASGACSRRASARTSRRPHGLSADRRLGQRPGPARTAAHDRRGRDVRALAVSLNAPLRFANVDLATKPVYHLAIAAAKDPLTGALVDRPLSDAQWADVAAEYLHQIGLARRGDEQAVRWVAVRHADDHIHVVATLARQDGRRVFPRNDHYRAREASLTVEARYGLTRTSPVGRTSSRPASRAESRKHEATVKARRDAGRPAPPAPDRLVLRQLVRAAAGGATGWEEFADKLHQQGVLVRARMSERDPGQITGYAVAMIDWDGTGTVWFGGGKLAADLTLPQLHRRWRSHQPPDGSTAAGRPRPTTPNGPGPDGSADAARDRFGLSAEERHQLWRAAHQAAERAAAQITSTVQQGADPRLAGDAAWAAADLLSVVAHLRERRSGGPYTDAARAFEHAGRELHHTPPIRTPAGRRLRTASAALSALGVALPSEARQLLALARQLLALAEAVKRLRETQRRTAQAAAARRACEHLLAVHPRPVAPAPLAASAWALPATVRSAVPPPPHRGRGR